MAVSPSRSDAPVEPSGPGLRRTLSVWQAVGLSVALMAPSMAANINPQGTDRPTACQTESVRRRPGPESSTGASGRDDETAMRNS